MKQASIATTSDLNSFIKANPLSTSNREFIQNLVGLGPSNKVTPVFVAGNLTMDKLSKDASILAIANLLEAIKMRIIRSLNECKIDYSKLKVDAVYYRNDYVKGVLFNWA